MLLTPDQARKLADALMGDGQDGDDGESVAADIRRFPDGAFGRYRITRLVGMGGMGEVYEAEQESPRRRVAIKVLRPELISPDLLRRFDHEARVLGRLQHPGIAQIFEAGRAATGAGATPFFAMEFVEGKPLTQWASDAKLDLKARLELFLKACEAVEHAHRHGIIHRDLKPGNILVGEDGRPRVLDFGVARATDADIRATTVHTEVGRLVGTLPYMSPEQVSGDPDNVDTRSDVYSLGIVLYELLAGRPPYEIKRGPVFDAVRTIRDADPAPLSTIDRSLRGDVEVIVARSLEKEVSRRYQSVSDLAADLGRFLRHEPIIARRASLLYQFRRLTRRHLPLVVLAILLAAVLVAGAVASAVLAFKWQAAAASAQALAQSEADAKAVADDQARAARREAVASRAVVEFVRRMLASENLRARGREAKIIEMLTAAADQIEPDLAGQPVAAVILRNTVGDSFLALGQFESAELQYRAAIRRAEGDAELDPRHRMIAFGGLAESLREQGRYPEALDAAERSLASTSDGSDAEIAADRLKVMNTKALILDAQGRRREAVEILRDAVSASEASLGGRDETTLSLRLSLGAVLRNAGLPIEAEELLDALVPVSREILGTEHRITLGAMEQRASLRIDRSAAPNVIDDLRFIVAVRTRLLGGTHPETLSAMSNLANALRRTPAVAESESIFRRVLEARRATLGPEHPSTLTTMNNLTLALTAQSKFEESLAVLEELLDIKRRVSGPEHPSTLTTMHNLAIATKDCGRVEEGAAIMERVVALRESALGPAHADTINSLAMLAQFRHVLGRDEEAELMLRDLLSRAEGALKPTDNTVINARRDLGIVLRERGKFEEAETELLWAYGAITDLGIAPGHARNRRMLQELARLYDVWSKPAEAARWRDALRAAEAQGTPPAAAPAPKTDGGQN